jgi:hypothetical protein
VCLCTRAPTLVDGVVFGSFALNEQCEFRKQRRIDACSASYRLPARHATSTPGTVEHVYMHMMIVISAHALSRSALLHVLLQNATQTQTLTLSIPRKTRCIIITTTTNNIPTSTGSTLSPSRTARMARV